MLNQSSYGWLSGRHGTWSRACQATARTERSTLAEPKVGSTPHYGYSGRSDQSKL
jgi:hypothetical protein